MEGAQSISPQRSEVILVNLFKEVLSRTVLESIHANETKKGFISKPDVLGNVRNGSMCILCRVTMYSDLCPHLNPEWNVPHLLQLVRHHIQLELISLPKVSRCR